MPYYVYILASVSFERYYVGQTSDVEARLARHNRGAEPSTSPYLPWKLAWKGEKPTRGEAMKLEKKLKNLSRLRIKAFIEKYS
jgi:putative endonuclease